MKKILFFMSAYLSHIAIGHESWKICDNTVLNWQFGIHCKGKKIAYHRIIFFSTINNNLFFWHTMFKIISVYTKRIFDWFESKIKI